MCKFIAFVGPVLGMMTATASAAEGLSWQTYENSRFGFVLSYPSDVFKEEKSASAGDGILFVAAPSGAKLLVGVLPNSERRSPASYQEYVRTNSYPGYTVDYQRRGKTWFALSGEGNGTTFYEKVLFSCDGGWITSFATLYPTAQKPFFDPIVERMEDSFKAGTKECPPAERADTSPQSNIKRSSPAKRTYVARERGAYAALADRIARSQGRNVIVVLRRTGPPYDVKRVRGYAAR